MHLADADATEAAGSALARYLRAGDIITLSGPLGAGKTSFVRGLIAGLGFSGEVPSPSFPIVIPYARPDVTLPVAHVDLYRIEKPGAIDELGLDDYAIDGAVVIEWPERLGVRLSGQSLRIRIDVLEDDARGLTAEVPPAWEGRWPFR